jgi:hypothetical protein
MRSGIVRLGALAGAVTSLAALISACSGRGTGTTTAAPPTVVCGTVLNDSPAGWVIYDATRHLRTITMWTGNDVLLFRVTRGCAKGAQVSWAPSSAAHLVKAAYAKDGRIAAVILKPNVPNASFQLTAKQNGRVVASATIQLAEP